MHMKHFQNLAYIEQTYDDIIEAIDSDIPFAIVRLLGWDITVENKDELRPVIIAEREAIRYLVSCRMEIADGTRTFKPETSVVNRALNRHLLYIERVHKCHAYNVNKHPNSIVRKKYKACTHYLFKFTLPAWVRDMPESIPTFDEKYPNFNK